MSPLIVTLTAAALLLGQSDLSTLSAVELRDQHGNADSLAAHHGRVVVVTVVEARRLRKLKGWEEALREQFAEGEVDYLRIADVAADRPVTYEEVANKLAGRVPTEVSVLIDLERRWASTLELDTSLPNLLLFDRKGRLFKRYRGRNDPYLETYVKADLTTLLETVKP